MKASRLLAFCISTFAFPIVSDAIGFPSCENPEMRLLCNGTIRDQFDHCFITVACGNEVYACRGGPETGTGGGGRTDLPAHSRRKGNIFFGKLRSGCRPYDERHADWLDQWKDDATPHARVDLLSKYPREMAECLKNNFELLDACVAYTPFPDGGKSDRSANSNSAVATALHRCGLGRLTFPWSRGGSPGDATIIDPEAVPCGRDDQRAHQRFRQTLEEVGALHLRHGNKLFSKPELKSTLSQAVLDGRARLAREEAEMLKSAIRVTPPEMTAPAPAESPAVAPAQPKTSAPVSAEPEKGAGRSGGESKSPGGN
jgi:hypothetical protein